MVPLVLLAMLMIFLGLKLRRYLKVVILSILLYILIFYEIKNPILLFAYVSIIIFISSIIQSFRKVKKREVEYYSLLLLLMAGVFGTLYFKNIVFSFIYFEMMCLISFSLVACEGNKKSLKASLKYSIFGILGSYIFIWGLSYYFAGNFLLASFFFFLGLCVEMAIFPFYFWLPDAHSEAPSQISAILSGVITSIAVLFFLKIYREVGIFDKNFAVLLSAFTMLLPALKSLSEKDIKRILAYSTIYNMGASLLILLSNDFDILIFYLIAHSISKALAFISSSDFGRELDRLKPGKVSSIFFLSSILSLSGLPPFIGFFAKVFAVVSILKIGILPAIVFLFSSALFIYSYFRIVNKIILRRSEEKFSDKHVPSLLLFIFLILFSILSFRILEVIRCMSG